MSVTLKELAEAAGVSIRSVTRALKNEPGGNQETTARIRALAAEKGYIPNMAARNLRLQQNNVVGMILGHGEVSMTVRKVYAMQRQLEREGYYPISALVPESAEELRAILKNWLGLVETVVFNAWNCDWKVDEVLQGLPLRPVFVDVIGKGRGVKIAEVAIDREAGIRDGITHLIRSGRRRVVQCGSRMPDRLQGFASALRQCGMDPAGSPLIETENLNHEDGYRAAPQIIGKCDAVFFHTDRMALGFLKYCYEHGVKVPGEVAVVGFDDEPADEYACPGLSSVAQPVEEMAERVMELVRPGGFKPGKTVFATKFIPRESV